jgi:hypothetical protein
MKLYTHNGQCTFDPCTDYRMPLLQDNTSKYIYPIEVHMYLTCPPFNDDARKEYVSNFSYDISDDIITDVKNNKCKIVFDFTSESYDTTYKYFGNLDYSHKIICNTMERYLLEKNDVILVCGNLNPYEPSEYNVVSFAKQLFLPLCQPETTLSVQRQLIKNKRIRSKKIVTFMGKPYLHRARLSYFIFENNLRKDNIVSVHTPFKDLSMDDHIDKLNLSNEYLESLPWIYDIREYDDSITSLQSSAERQAYKDTYINFVSETYFEHTSKEYNDFELDMTDKCTKPIVSMQPFVLHAQVGALQYLKDLGFKTFDKWWDEGYDLEKDHSTRYNQLINLYSKFSKASHTELSEMLYEMYDILEYNKNFYDEYKDSSKQLQDFYEKIKYAFKK